MATVQSPSWAQSEREMEEAKDFLREGNTVDFFEEVASAVLRDHPENLPSYCLALVQAKKSEKHEAAQNSSSSDQSATAKTEEDNKYMRNSKLSEFLDKWILAFLEVRPRTDEERLAFHESYLSALADDVEEEL